MSLFVTGTDTGIGKTIIAAWLCAHTGARYYKPIQTGCLGEKDSDVIRSLANSHTLAESYLLCAPLSPYEAAKKEGITIDPGALSIPMNEKIIVEGAGGALCPICRRFFMADLISRMQLPALVVARSSLGTINHTCLTIEALRQRNIPIIAVVVNGPKNTGNEDAIRELGQVDVMTFPHLDCLEEIHHIFLPELLQSFFGG